MGWLLLGIIVFFVFRWIAGSGGKGQDDFAGNSTKSYFLLDEFIDEPSDNVELFDQDETYYEVDDFDWFEEEE
ncbi:MAG: hypothetical protein JRC87_11710 [Deltaproteobacteria bacterium]|nr:hypothetical protein [Deltaproteobacteria bacterium]